MEDAIVISASVRSRHYGKLSGGLAPLPGVARVGAFGGHTYAESGRAPATIFSLSLPPCFPGFAEPGGKQKTAPKDRSKQLISLRELGAGEGIRTLDPNLGKVEIVTPM
jgi:hypothetical protein